MAFPACVLAAFANTAGFVAPDKLTQDSAKPPRHATRIIPQISKIKTAKDPNREPVGSPILPTVILADPRGPDRRAKGGSQVQERRDDKV